LPHFFLLDKAHSFLQSTIIINVVFSEAEACVVFLHSPGYTQATWKPRIMLK